MKPKRAEELVDLLTDEQVMMLTRHTWPDYWCGDDMVGLIEEGRHTLLEEIDGYAKECN